MKENQAFTEICYFLQAPLTQRDYERFGFELMRKKGFKVNALDISILLNPYYSQKTDHSSVDFHNITVVNNKLELENYFKQQQNRFFGIDTLGGPVKGNVFFYRILKKYNIQYASLCNNCIPQYRCLEWNAKDSLFKKITLLLKKSYSAHGLNLLSHYRYFLSLFLTHGWGIQQPRLILAGGAQSKKMWKKELDLTVVWAHALDYDLYLEYNLRRPEPAIDRDYVVFLDEYFPLHPDLFLQRDMAHERVFNEPQDYYTPLNNFFTALEKKTGLPVVIAAHPRSEYENLPDYFSGRKVLKGSTLNLVAQAKFVLAHGSTAINFAVLFKKAIIFLTLNAIEKDRYGYYLSNMASQFNKRPVNIESDFPDLDRELNINEVSHANYLNNYIKTRDSIEKPFWEIVAEAIISIN